jgi:hypothetical protein
MDFRIVTIGDQHILLERCEADGEAMAWQVIISTFVASDQRFDDWVLCSSVHVAQQYIKDFSDTAARQFLSSAEQAISQKPATVDA